MAAFVTLHSLPAEHFVYFERVLRVSHPTYMILGDVAKKALRGSLPYFDLDSLDKSDMSAFANEVARVCEFAKIIFVAIGHASSGYILKAIYETYGDTKRVIVYYDNPEAFVPGGYTEVAQAAIRFGKPKEILFANKNLVSSPLEIFGDLPGVKKRGLGFYAIEQVETLKDVRAVKENRGEKVFLYLGGSETNTEYMEKALPAFIEMLKKMSFEEDPAILYFKAHPRSSGADFLLLQAICKPGLTLLKAPKDLLRSLSIADYVLYYQTSLSPLLVLVGIQVIQVGHEIYHETLVDKGVIPVATTFEELERIVKSVFLPPCERVVYDAIGFDPYWKENLLALLNN